MKAGEKPYFPPHANQNILGWCYSYETRKQFDLLDKIKETFVSIPEPFLCDYSFQIMGNPVSFRTCEHKFDEDQITRYMNNEKFKGNNPKCPVKTDYSSTCDAPLDFKAMKVDLVTKDKIEVYLQQMETSAKNAKKIKVVEDENAQLKIDNKKLKNENDVLENIKEIGSVRFARWEKLQKKQSNIHQEISIPTVHFRSKSYQAVDLIKYYSGSARNFEASLNFENDKHDILDVYFTFERLKNKSAVEVLINEKQKEEIGKNLKQIESPKTPPLKSTPINSPEKDYAMDAYEKHQNELNSNISNLKSKFQNVLVDVETYGKIASKAERLKEKTDPKNLTKLSHFISRTSKSRLVTKSVEPVKQEPKNSGVFSNAYNYFFGSN